MKAIERLCVERDAGRCRHCGTTNDISPVQISKSKIKTKFEVHLSNLITLCRYCSDRSDLARNSPDTNKVGVLLAGGRGTRLAPLTLFRSKHSLGVGLLPMIMYPLKALREFGVKRVLVVTERSALGETAEILGSGNEFGIEISYKIQDGANGISDALYLAKDFAKPDDEIVCILGDNIFDLDELDTDVSLDDGAKACVWLKEVDNPKDYGVAEVKDGRVISIVEKPKHPKSNTAVLGLYMYDYSVFDVIGAIEPSERGELEISAVNDHYAKSEELIYRTNNSYWLDCGSSIQKYCEASLHGARKANVSEEEVKEFVSTVFDDK